MSDKPYKILKYLEATERWCFDSYQSEAGLNKRVGYLEKDLEYKVRVINVLTGIIEYETKGKDNG